MLFRTLASVCFVVSWGGIAISQEVKNQFPVFTPSPVVDGAFHSGWARIDADGRMQGQVVTLSVNGELAPAPRTAVHIEGDSGVSVRALTDENGNFQVEGLRPGIYFLEAAGPMAYAAFSFQTIESESAGLTQVYATRMASEQVVGILRELWTPQEKSPVPSLGQIDPASIPQQQSAKYICVDGSIHGQLAFPFAIDNYATCIVRAYQNGKLVASAPVDSAARFTLAVPTGGIVDLIVGGSGTVACMSVYVEHASQLSRSEPAGGERRFVATAIDLQGQTLMVPVRPAPVQPDDRQGEEERRAALPPAPGPGFAGGGFGGGGGAGGGGGIGGAGAALGAAGLAVGVAALSNDDGFNVNLSTGIGP